MIDWPLATDLGAEAFKAELTALLLKYHATIEALDHFDGYPECGSDIRITATLSALATNNGEIQREFTQIDLGDYIVGFGGLR